MERMEKFPENFDDYSIDDHVNTSYFLLLRRLPEALAVRHVAHIEMHALNEEESEEYLKGILEKRGEALTETVISDMDFLERIKDQKDEILEQIETDVFTNTENFLGSGMTARVKFFEISDERSKEKLPVAVKYLLTPTKMTLSASAEHDMLVEVGRIQTIELLEEDAHLKFIKVPHPYFHHQNSKIQCYGMELVDGFDLSHELESMEEGVDRTLLIDKLSALDISNVENEIDVFFTRMHTYCIHGDMKPANIMVNKDGMFYVIDFGQSRLVSDISDKAQDQLYTLREDEIRIAKACVRKIISDAKKLVAD
jgi:serine/threonine protein kinase